MADKTVVTGDKELVRKLDNLKKTGVKKALRKGSRAGAKMLQKSIKQNAPKKTGNLKKSIRVRAIKRSRKSVGCRIVLKFVGNGEFHDGFYGAFQEYGFTARNGQWVEGKGFMKKASQQTGIQAIHTFQQIAKQVIEQEARKGK